MTRDPNKPIKLPDLSGETDVGKLDRWMEAGKREGVEALYDMALRRKIDVLGGNPEDPLDFEMMRVIAAREHGLKIKHGKNQQAAYLRRKYGNDGAEKTFADLAGRPEPTDGFDGLIESGFVHCTAEHVVLRYPHRFDPAVRKIAAERLELFGIDLPLPTIEAEKTS